MTLVAAILVWLTLGLISYLLFGVAGIFWVLFGKAEVESTEELVGVLAGKLIGCAAVVILSVNNGWLGPLIGAIVHAIKNA